jgi:hypothetical protein
LANNQTTREFNNTHIKNTTTQTQKARLTFFNTVHLSGMDSRTFGRFFHQFLVSFFQCSVERLFTFQLSDDFIDRCFSIIFGGLQFISQFRNGADRILNDGILFFQFYFQTCPFRNQILQFLPMHDDVEKKKEKQQEKAEKQGSAKQ